MDWNALEKAIPYVSRQSTPEAPNLVTVVYDAPDGSVMARQPGLYWDLTTPRGGDFLITLTDRAASWHEKPFTHRDIFSDIQSKTLAAPEWMRLTFARALVLVVAGEQDPDAVAPEAPPELPGASSRGLLRAAQCLALCEHRRYKQYEPVGGRCLPMRYCLGIIHQLWTAEQAGACEKKGRTGLYELRGMAGRAEPDPITLVLKRELKACCRVERKYGS